MAHHRAMRIGIPRALGFFYFGAFWESFLSALGHVPVSSGPTDRRLLDEGGARTPGEACLPLKAFVGHVCALAGKVDLLFLPRLVCLRTDPRIKLCCPKLIGLPDMIRALRPDLPFLSIDLDLRAEAEVFTFLRMARPLERSEDECLEAYHAARAVLRSPFLPASPPAPASPGNATGRKKVPGNATGQKEGPQGDPGDPVIGLIGHSYLLDDPYLGLDLKRKLKGLGCGVLSGHDLPRARVEEWRERIQPVSWVFEEQILFEAATLLALPEVAGVVQLLSFGCGAGSITAELIDLEIRPETGKPLLRLVVDEHSAEAGLMTRLESFVDMLRLREARA